MLHAAEAVAKPINGVDVAGTVTRAGAGRRGEGPLTLQLPTAHHQHGARGKLPRSRHDIYVSAGSFTRSVPIPNRNGIRLGIFYKDRLIQA